MTDDHAASTGPDRPGRPEALTDEELLRALGAMWRDLDPAPSDLHEQMAAVVASADLEAEWELLTVVAASDGAGVGAGVGARGAGPDVLELTGPGLHVVLRLSRPTPESTVRRIDGWLSPATPGTVLLLPPDPGGDPVASTVGAAVDPEGRFVLDGVDPGSVRLRFELDSGLRRESPPFTV